MTFAYGALTLYGARFHNASARHRFCNSLEDLPFLRVGPTTPGGLGLSRFARRYSGSCGCFPFLGVLRCFNSPGALHRPYVFRPG